MEDLSPEEVIHHGTEALQVLDFAKAEEYFTYALKQNQYSADAHLGFARLYLMQSNMESALFWGKKAKSLTDDKGDATALIASCYLRQNKVEQARKLLEGELENSPSNPRVLHQLGKALTLSGESKEAIQCLQQALETTETPEVVHYDLAVARFDNPKDSDEVEKAIDHLTSAIEANPGFPAPYFLFSNVCVKLSIVDEAINVLEGGVGFNPNMIALREELYALYMIQQDTEKAMVQAVEIATIRGAPTDVLRIGNTAVAAEDYKGALVAYKKALEQTPEDPSVLLNMAHVYRIQGNRKKAVETYRKVAMLAPQSHKPFLGMGLVSLEIDKKPEEARELFLSALKIAAKDYEVLIHLALSEKSLGNTEASQEYAKKAQEVARTPRESERAEELQ